MSSSIFAEVDLLSKALEASWMRNEVIANNIANVDTPGYKKKDIAFQDYLLQASQNYKNSNRSLHTDQPKVVVDHSELSYRMDGNNVDIDVEMSKRAQNELYYNAVIRQVSHQFRQINTVLNAK